jgi:DNA-binding response OmpR family regulator
MDALILLVDDEPKIVRLARDFLEKDGFRVVSASDGVSALAMARRVKPDLIVLDLMLPGMDGLQVCRTLRQETAVPIIMLTARAEESDQLIGLELGADDYITKPFSPRALVARVRAVLRRAQNQVKAPSMVRAGRLEIDVERHQASIDGKSLPLTPNEFKLLTLLAQYPGQILSREQLLDDLHGAAYASFDRSIDSHIKNLRHKLEASLAQTGCIEAVYGVGYRFSPPE